MQADPRLDSESRLRGYSARGLYLALGVAVDVHFQGPEQEET